MKVWLAILGLVPGDMRIERETFTFYFPITTGVIASLAVSLVIWRLRR